MKRNVLFVLHRPQAAENIGAAARALKNLGYPRLAIVAPAAWGGAPRTAGAATAQADVLARARTVARRAADVLDGASIHPDLASAVAAATWVCGTTSRAVEGRPQLSPRDLGAELARRSAAGEVAVVFGEERRGLSDAELELCQAVCTIPTDAAYDSMNLAQAAAILAWEAAEAEASPAGPARGAAEEPARHATLEALWDRLRVVLDAAGYLNRQNPEHILADYRRLLARADPSQREAELLVAALRALERVLRERGG